MEPRLVRLSEPGTTTMFSPLQLRPRFVLGQASSGLARWLGQYVTPFPAMVAEYGNAVVVTDLRIDDVPGRPGFTEAASVDVRCGLTLDPAGERMRLTVDCAAGGRPLAHAVLSARVLSVAEGAGLSAGPGVLHAALRERFTPAETVPVPRPPDPHPGHGPEVLPEQEWRTFISRSHAEVADQWSYIEMAELATQARERLFTEGLHGELPPHRVIGTPTRTLHAFFRRPMFVYDACVVRTSAHAVPDTGGLCFRHRIGPPGARRAHLTVCEVLEPQP
ncbi:hypothetical protein [Streptomyces indicus]|uniref:A-factor biosynthesis hotdog domain-containing protein n=1 Tax=Streptomyces indicus TaxID=417292 RepID=A0A1G8VVX0_9ACTN|nr:hypothetical protein [Streptomyces indicus]SDJ70214.1 hypothetical protein SAMN05421806_10279 [Streptomyces indicus]